MTKESSREYLNKLIVRYNKLETEIDDMAVKIKNNSNEELILDNIARIHRDKSVENYYLFENCEFGETNSLRLMSEKNWALKLKEASILLREIVDRFSKNILVKNKKKNSELKEKIIQYNECCNYINKYNIIDNMIDLLIQRYESIDYTKVFPGTYLNLYINDVKTIIELGYYDNFKKDEEKLIEFIKAKENECSKYQNEYLNNVLGGLKKVADERKGKNE